MTNEKQVIEGTGVLIVLEEASGTRGPYWKVKIGETQGNLFEYEAGKKATDECLRGREVKFIAENNGSFINFKSIQPVTHKQVDMPTPSPKPELFNGQAFGLCCHLAQRALSSQNKTFEADETWELYRELVRTFYSVNIEEKNKLIGGD